jgi:hypothetical protein
MKLLRGVVSLDTIQEAEACLKYNRSRQLLPPPGRWTATLIGIVKEDVLASLGRQT